MPPSGPRQGRRRGPPGGWDPPSRPGAARPSPGGPQEGWPPTRLECGHPQLRRGHRHFLRGCLMVRQPVHDSLGHQVVEGGKAAAHARPGAAPVPRHPPAPAGMQRCAADAAACDPAQQRRRSRGRRRAPARIGQSRCHTCSHSSTASACSPAPRSAVAARCRGGRRGAGPAAVVDVAAHRAADPRPVPQRGTCRHRSELAGRRLRPTVIGRGVAAVRALRDELTGLPRTMITHATIERAKGRLMERFGCTADEAFMLLDRVSQRSNTTLSTIAADVVEDSAEAPASGAARGEVSAASSLAASTSAACRSLPGSALAARARTTSRDRGPCRMTTG